MITRRDALKLAALAAGGAPFAVPPEQAAALLDAPAVDQNPLAAGVPAGGAWEPRAPTYDPAGFARDLVRGEALDDGEDLLCHVAPDEMAAYKQALAALYRDLPILRSVPHDHPINRLDEAALSAWSAAFAQGVRAGAAAEHLRLALLGGSRECRRCQGHGAVWGGSGYLVAFDPDGEEPCPTCGGRGTVPTPAPTLALSAD